MATLLYKLGHFSVRNRRLVLVVWLAILVGIGLGAQAAGGETEETFDLPGTESQEAADLLAERFPSQAGSTARIVFEAPEGKRLDDPGIVEGIREALTDIVFLDGVVTPTDASFVTIAPDVRIAFAEIRFEKSAIEVPHEDVEILKETALRSVPPIVKVTFGGDVINAAGQEEGVSSELIGMGVAVIVLLIAFGSVIAMGLPLITAVIGVAIGMMGITLTSAFIDISSTAPILATMIGLAVGIDYALFIVTRHRSFLHSGYDVEESAARANATSGTAVVFAGMTVVIAIAGLAVAGIPFLTVLGLAAAGTVMIAVLIAVTLIPAMLGFAGKNIDKLSIPGMKPTTGEDERPEDSWSGKFAGMVTGHPLPFLIAGVAVMGLLAVPAIDLRLGLPDDGTKPEGSEQRVAYDTLAEGFGPGFNGTLSLVLDVSDVTDREALLTLVGEAASGTEGVQSVSAPIANAEGNTAILTVVPTTGPADSETEDLVKRLREDVLPPVVEGSGASVSVAGSTAANIDISDKLTGALPLFMVLVIGLIVLLLLVVFRSVLVPIKAGLAILLSIASSFGVLVAVFQWGWLAEFIGVESTVPIVSFLPLIMFAILFGLSMDYEVFILSRIREDFSHNGNLARRAVLTGLTSSARVITAAALIMISVFAAFVLGDDVTIKMFGIGLATAVFLDATVVRMIIVPSVMALLDKSAWWLPGWLGKVMPDIDIEGAKLVESLEGAATAPASAS